MAKTDFTKVEERLVEGMRKIQVQKLLEQAGAKNTKKPLLPQQAAEQDSQKKQLSQSEMLRNKMLQALRRDLNKLAKKGCDAYEKFGISKQEIKKFIDNPASLSSGEWEKIKAITDRVQNYKKEMLENVEKGLDEKIVENERIKHVNKRYNIKDGWLPLH